MTYSIVVRDPRTGRFGVAVQTRYFSVGSVVPWAEPGVGAVATQSFTEISYGPRGLELMRAGASSLEALETLLAEDDGRDLRQVAMVDANGSVAVHTGARCVQAAGHAIGDGFSAQANMMERDTVWDAMVAAYAAAGGDLGERLMAALRAAEAEGGDMRGRQSAAMLVVEGDPHTPGGIGSWTSGSRTTPAPLRRWNASFGWAAHTGTSGGGTTSPRRARWSAPRPSWSGPTSWPPTTTRSRSGTGWCSPGPVGPWKAGSSWSEHGLRTLAGRRTCAGSRPRDCSRTTPR